MKIAIEVWRNDLTRREFVREGPDYIFDVPPRSGALPRISVRSSNKFAAGIVKMQPDEPRGSYILQIGKNPDIRAKTTAVGDGSSFVFKNGDDEYVQLPQGVMGTSLLYLIRLEDAAPLVAIAEISVEPDGSDSRPRFYDEMVKDLLDANLPHFVIDDFKWQMRRNKFALGWQDGYASSEDANLMLLHISRAIRDMRPLILQIDSLPQMSFRETAARRRISNISGCGERTLRDISAAMVRLGAQKLEDISEEKVWVPRRIASYGTPAHDVIFTFLEELVRDRLRTIEDDLISGRDELERKQEKEKLRTDIYGQAKDDRLTDIKANLDSVKRKLGLLRRLLGMTTSLMRCGIFKEAARRLSVFNVTPQDFSGNAAYEKLYRIMLEFSRVRFWWVRDRPHGLWRVPKVELSKDGESRLQLKYSIVYENWCYAKMVASMLEIGYEWFDGKTLRENGGWRAVFRRGDLFVTLLHGVTAQENGGEETEFAYVGGNRRFLTPDYAIVVESAKKGQSVWIVLDAKSDNTIVDSDGRLKTFLVKHRNKYAYYIRRNGNKPIASILMISGEKEKDFRSIGGVSFPPPKIKLSDRDQENDFNDHTDGTYKWRGVFGVVSTGGDRPPYHGHVYVNVESLKRNAGLFREFMEGIIATAVREMELEADD